MKKNLSIILLIIGLHGANLTAEQFSGRILGKDTDWLTEASEAVEASNPEKYPDYRIKGSTENEKLVDCFLLRYQIADQLQLGNGLSSSMHRTKVRLQGITVKYDAECTLDRKSSFNFTIPQSGFYTLSFTVSQPGISSDQPRINQYSYDVYLDSLHAQEQNLVIYCWDIFIPVKGRVVDVAGNPVVGAQIYAFHIDTDRWYPRPLLSYYQNVTQNSWSTVTDSDGRYELTLPSYFPPAYVMYQRGHRRAAPFQYYITARTKDGLRGASPYFFPVNEEVRLVTDRMRRDFPAGNFKRDDEMLKQNYFPEKDNVLLCPDILVKKSDEKEHPEIQEWRNNNEDNCILRSGLSL